MAVTMEDVRTALDPDEPDYAEAAGLGPEAIPHLEVLVASGDPMLAAKATYLASLIKDRRTADVLRAAARSDEPVVRVAAANAASNLAASQASSVLVDLVDDADAGVRRVARAAVPTRASAALTRKLEQTEPDDGQPEAEDGEGTAPPTAPLLEGTMPGESPGPMPRGGLMPGEQPGGASGGLMPGEQPGGTAGRNVMPGA